MLKEHPLDPTNTVVWVDMGYWEEDEEDEVDPLEDSRELAELLNEQGFSNGIQFYYFEDSEGSHDEYSWGKRIVHVLEFFFGLPEIEEFN